MALLGTMGLALAGAAPAHAGLDGPLSTASDQHCVTDVAHAGGFTLLEPTDRVTVSVEAAGHDPADHWVWLEYSVPGSVNPTKVVGHFDPDRHNVFFTFDIPYPATGSDLVYTSNVIYADGTSFSDHFDDPLLNCTQSPAPQPDFSVWSNFEATSFAQTCGVTRPTIIKGMLIHPGVPYDLVTVNVAAGAPYDWSTVANDTFWTGYWIRGSDPNDPAPTYIPGTTGAFGPIGAPVTVSFTILDPPHTGELNILTSTRSSDGWNRTEPSQSWAAMAC
ncbi:hypothetical protein GA0115240_152212 [Streptomyces sp. DvalAA-14]|nr:hypothetical protein [Streptomyces sp. SID4948]MYS23343.1 hypothetical protein [Streptomyces sp. SID4948]SCE31917.1 hypothetical protein GA0115240_152212 [Streptomyces sp. DvalAA-14]